MEDDVEVAENIFRMYPDDITARISKIGDTALHIAAIANHVGFVKMLVSRMKREDLGLRNMNKNTAFCLAATSGKVELAKIMLKENDELAMIRGSQEMLPLHMAALLHHESMVSYLYGQTSDLLNDKDRIELFIILIRGNIYGELKTNSNSLFFFFSYLNFLFILGRMSLVHPMISLIIMKPFLLFIKCLFGKPFHLINIG